MKLEHFMGSTKGKSFEIERIEETINLINDAVSDLAKRLVKQKRYPNKKTALLDIAMQTKFIHDDIK